MGTLAKSTGGKYYSGRDVSKLSLIYDELTEELESTYTVTFASRHPDDGTARNVEVYVERGGQTRQRRRQHRLHRPRRHRAGNGPSRLSAIACRPRLAVGRARRVTAANKKGE